MGKDKTSNVFDKGISFLAILAFATILLDTMFDISWITQNIGNILILGAGLLFLIEGKAITVFNQLWNVRKRKMQRKMIPKIFVVLVGLVAVIVGGLGLFDISTVLIETIKGGLSLTAIIIIILETWVIN